MLMLPSAEQRQSVGMRALRRLWWVLFSSHFYLLEFIVAGGTTIWGFWLANPYWDTFTKSPSYDPMAAVAPEAVWGLFILGMGGVQIVMLALRLLWPRRIIAFVAMFVWLWIAVMFWQSNYQTTAAPVYGWMFAGSQVLTFWRLMGERRDGAEDA